MGNASKKYFRVYLIFFSDVHEEMGKKLIDEDNFFQLAGY